MRDMMTLRRGIELARVIDAGQETPGGQPAVRATMKSSGLNQTGSLSSTTRPGFGSGLTPRSSIIRKPTQIFVDADTNN
jgi:hypothetical protein